MKLTKQTLLIVAVIAVAVIAISIYLITKSKFGATPVDTAGDYTIQINGKYLDNSGLSNTPKQFPLSISTSPYTWKITPYTFSYNADIGYLRNKPWPTNGIKVFTIQDPNGNYFTCTDFNQFSLDPKPKLLINNIAITDNKQLYAYWQLDTDGNLINYGLYNYGVYNYGTSGYGVYVTLTNDNKLCQSKTPSYKCNIIKTVDPVFSNNIKIKLIYFINYINEHPNMSYESPTWFNTKMYIKDVLYTYNIHKKDLTPSDLSDVNKVYNLTRLTDQFNSNPSDISYNGRDLTYRSFL